MVRSQCFGAGILVLGLFGSLLAQDTVPPIDPTLPERLKELKTLVADTKMRQDFQAIGLIQHLTKEPEKQNPKDRERLVKALGDVFRTGKVRPADKDILYRETADALARLSGHGAREMAAKELAKAYEDKRLDDMIPLRAHLLVALGKTEDEKQVDLLIDTATRSPHDELRAASGEALGFFTSLDAGPRRDVVKKLIREWGSLHARATTPDPTDPNAPIDMGPQNARRTLRVVEGKWQASLSKLTGVQHSAFPEWQRWLNKNPNWPLPPAPKKP